jgi:hypothetical protein
MGTDHPVTVPYRASDSTRTAPPCHPAAFLLGTLVLLAAFAAHGAASSSYQISIADVGVSGGTAASASHSLTSCIGSPIGGSAASGSYRVEASCGVLANVISAVAAPACGAADGVPVSSAPSANLCSAGTASAVAGAGPWTWTCSSSGVSASCSAPRIQPAASEPIPTLSSLGLALLGSLLALAGLATLRRRPEVTRRRRG